MAGQHRSAVHVPGILAVVVPTYNEFGVFFCGREVDAHSITNFTSYLHVHKNVNDEYSGIYVKAIIFGVHKKLHPFFCKDCWEMCSHLTYL